MDLDGTVIILTENDAVSFFVKFFQNLSI